jgi:hypothetical protein
MRDGVSCNRLCKGLAGEDFEILYWGEYSMRSVFRV